MLHHAGADFYGFQYVDWQFDGKDIILASRTAFDDVSGGAHSFHDANFLTFHRIAGFRQFGAVKLKGSHFMTAEVVSPQQIQKWAAATASAAAKHPDGIASQAIGRYESHTTTLSTRTKTGEAEQHRYWSDIFVVISGEASLVSGGHLSIRVPCQQVKCAAARLQEELRRISMPVPLFTLDLRFPINLSWSQEKLSPIT